MKQKKSKDGAEIIVEIVILLIFLKPMFGLGILTGIGYLFAIGSALWTGILLKKKEMARYIVFGTILSYGAARLVPNMFSALNNEDWISFMVILVVASMFWINAYYLKKGKDVNF